MKIKSSSAVTLQARLGKLSERMLLHVGGASAWTATLLFMWGPVAQMVKPWFLFHFGHERVSSDVLKELVVSSVKWTNHLMFRMLCADIIQLSMRSGPIFWTQPTSKDFHLRLFCWLWLGTVCYCLVLCSSGTWCGSQVRHGDAQWPARAFWSACTCRFPQRPSVRLPFINERWWSSFGGFDCDGPIAYDSVHK